MGNIGLTNKQIEQYHELVYVELEPGDTLFFHCNLLHKSSQNQSDKPRWVMISAYNAILNWRTPA
jgi:ectoine hydroxylase-related dioxygenase (phytanoyl-CoA dioxygenase family)